MQHLSRWRTVTAVASTAAIAAGALGLANAFRGDSSAPTSIELVSGETDEREPTLTEPSTDRVVSTTSPVSTRSVQSPAAPVVTSRGTTDQTASHIQPVSVDSPPSPPSAPSPVSPASPPSVDSPLSPPSPDSPASIDSDTSVDS